MDTSTGMLFVGFSVAASADDTIVNCIITVYMSVCQQLNWF